jgi:alanyl-tRNA synthetase
VVGVIRGEEAKAHALFDRAPAIVGKVLRKRQGRVLDGPALFELHATHGLDPSIVESVVGTLSRDVHGWYEQAMYAHRAISRAGKGKVR